MAQGGRDNVAQLRDRSVRYGVGDGVYHNKRCTNRWYWPIAEPSPRCQIVPVPGTALYCALAPTGVSIVYVRSFHHHYVLYLDRYCTNVGILSPNRRYPPTHG